jgi:hypothetical protein
MPLFRRSPSAPTPPLDPDQWRPQPYAQVDPRSVTDPIVEPAWGGVRVLVRLRRAAAGSPNPRPKPRGRPQLEAVITDEDGVDCTAEFADVAGAIVEAARVQEAILDGFLTIEATQAGEGFSIPLPEASTGGQLMRQLVLGDNRRKRPEPAPALDGSKPIAFVAVDLLSIDESRIVDVPLLERKRILGGALEESERVRITPFVRPPLGSLEMTWKAHGFRELVYKPANGRYSPAGEPGDWAVARIRTR